jgi:hypothetical protein
LAFLVQGALDEVEGQLEYLTAERNSIVLFQGLKQLDNARAGAHLLENLAIESYQPEATLSQSEKVAASLSELLVTLRRSGIALRPPSPPYARLSVRAGKRLCDSAVHAYKGTEPSSVEGELA